MNIRLLSLLLFVLTCLFPLASQETAIETESYLPVSGSFVMMIEDYEKGKKVRSYEFEGLKLADDYYLLVAVQPRVMQGWVQMRIGEIIYAYNRKADITRQSSAKANFLQSMFSQEDIMSVKLNRLYRVSDQRSVIENGKEYLLLTFLPRFDELSYRRITTLYEKNSGLPVRRQYYSSQDKLVKQMDITAIDLEGGKLVNFEFTMQDILRSGFYSKVSFKGWRTDLTITANQFTQAAMKSRAR